MALQNDVAEDRFRQLLTRNDYQEPLSLLEKLGTRRHEDVSGTITTSKALVESACKTVLNELAQDFKKTDDLPKLYSRTSSALKLDPKSQANESLKRAFSAFYTFVQSISEVRNSYGDAHGYGRQHDVSPIALDELAAQIAIGLSNFLLRNLERRIIAERMTNEAGRPVLKFEKAGLWRQLDHVRNSDEIETFYGEEIGPSLILVGDNGVYLMSNGKPAMNSRGLRLKSQDKLENGETLLVSYAIGCDPTVDEFDYWWNVRSLFDDGSDFSIPLGVEAFEEALELCDSFVFVSIHDEHYEVIPDVAKTEWV